MKARTWLRKKYRPLIPSLCLIAERYVRPRFRSAHACVRLTGCSVLAISHHSEAGCLSDHQRFNQVGKIPVVLVGQFLAQRNCGLT